MAIFVLAVLMTCTMAEAATPKPDHVIERPSVGTFLHAVDQISVIDQVWQHVSQINLPSTDRRAEMSNVSQNHVNRLWAVCIAKHENNTFCRKQIHMMSIFDSLYGKQRQHLVEAIDKIYTILPAFPEGSRRSRALCCRLLLHDLPSRRDLSVCNH